MVIQQQPSSLSDRPQVSSMVKSRRRSVSPAEPSYRLAQALVKQEKWQEAIAAYQQALTITPNWVEVQRELGDLFLKLERWDEAVQVYETAISLRSESAEVYHNLGDALLKLQRWEDAIAAYEKAIELNPEFSWSYNNLGDGLRELQRWDEAAQAYGKAIELKPDFALSHHNLGDILVKKEDWEGAITTYQKAVDLDPNFVWSYYNLGDILVKKEDWERAITAYRNVIKLDPNLPQVHEKLGDALQHQSQRDYEEISQVYHRAVADNPTDLEVYYKALEANPQDAEMSLKLADTLRNQGKLEQAITFYKSALQIESNNAEIQAVAWQNLGDVLRYLRHFEEAAKSYRQLVELKPEWAGSHFNLIRVLLKLGRLQEAEKAGDKAVEIEPRLANFYRNWGVIKGDILAFDTADQIGGRPKVAVCSWELAHNPAGRAYTLAQLYQAIADVEIIGSIFPKYGRELWEPIRKISIPCHSFTVEDEGLFVEQAMNLVLTHPYDIVHLSKPRMPNILFGLLYKMVWDARVIVDIDDEELGFVQAETPIEFEDFLKSQGQLPELKKLTGKEWTQIAVGLVKEFDGVTVSNPALQKRYGGEIIRHARDEKLFEPSSELRSQSREHLGISQDKKVVLFFGTPRKHKGLVATAEALATLGQQDVVFVIVGDFPDPSLKAKLQAIQGVEYLFLGNQPFDQIPDVVAVGDVCVLLQDGESAVSQFQIPAKLSDALGMGLTVLMSESGAVKDIVDSGAVIRVTEQDLGAALSRVLSDGAEAQMLGSNARELFTREFTWAKNGQRLAFVLGSVMGRSTSKGLLSDGLNLLLGGLPSVSSVLSGWGEQKVESKALSKVSQGVSVIVLSLNGAALLDRLLSTFFATNTYFPVELIIIDHGSTDNTAEIVAKQAIKGDVRYINRGGNYSFSDSCNCGATQAKYPHLLFLNNDIVFTEDVLPLAVGKLDNSGIGAVGVRLDDDPSLLPNGKEPGVQHTGIEFVWNENRGYFQPEQIRHPSLKDYLVQKSQGDFFTAVTGAFLLCRKMEFEKLGGFSRNYDYGLEDIDFCLRLGRDLQKKCYCINEVSLQHLEGATRKLGNASNNIEKNHQVFKQIWDNHLRDLIVKQKSEPDRKVTLELLKVSIDPQNSASLGEEKHHISLRFKGFIESFDRYNAKGWVANTELVFDRIRLLVEKIDLGAIPISKISSDVEKELESNSSKSRFIAHLGGILQFSSANLRHLKISLIPDMKDIEISKIAPVTAELANFWDESITFNPLLSHEQNSDFPVILQSLSLIDSREILCIFIANKNYTEKEVKIVFVQENDDSLTNDRDIQIIATHQCSLSSEFVPLRIPCKKLVKPLLIVVQDLNDTILFTDCIPYPSLLSHTNQLFTEHLCLVNNIPKNRALSRLSLQILTNQVKLHKINFNSFLPWQEISIILVDLFNTQIPRELGTVTENINLCPLKECNLYQLVNPTPPFNDFQLIAYGQKPDVNQPLKKIEAVSLFKSFITENIKSKYVLLLDKHTILRPDFLSFVIEYCVSEQPDSIYDIFYWNSMVYPIGQTPFLLQRSPFIYPEVALNNGTPVFSLLVSTEFWVEHLEDFLKLYQTQPQLSSLLGMTEPSKVKFIEEYLETVEVPIPHISNQKAKNLPESKITIADKPEIRGFHAIPTQEKSLLLSPNTYKQFTQLKGISIIINFRDKQDLTNLCLESIRIQKFAPKLQIILVNNRSKVEQRQSVLEKAYELFGKAAVKIIDYEFAFNHSEQCNIAAREADYDLLVLMNNDVVLGSEDLFAKLSAYSLLPNVATVGCKLLARKSANSYSIKSAGMFLRPKPTAAFGGGIVGEYLPPDILSNSNYLCLGNTFALAFIPKQVYWSLNGLDGVNFPTDYNDVDFCLRAIQDGLNHIVVNDCIAIHNGIASRADTSEYPASLGLISSMKNFGLLTKPTNFYPFL